MDKETRKKIHNLVDQIMDLLERGIIKKSIEVENMSHERPSNKDNNFYLSTDYIANIIDDAIESASECLLSQDS